MLERSLRHPLEDDVEGQTEPPLSRVLTGVTSLSGTAMITLKLLPPLLRLFDVDAVVDDEQHSDAIPLDKAESKLLFSDDGVLAGLLGSELTTRFELMMFNVLGGTFVTPENRFDVKMSMSACVISSSIQR